MVGRSGSDAYGWAPGKYYAVAAYSEDGIVSRCGKVREQSSCKACAYFDVFMTSHEHMTCTHVGGRRGGCKAGYLRERGSMATAPEANPCFQQELCVWGATFIG